MKKLLALAFGSLALMAVSAAPASAHQSGCHRWHSCPSDTGSYVCGDTGYSNYCPTSDPTPVTTPTTAPLVPATTASKPTTTTTTRPPTTTTTTKAPATTSTTMASTMTTAPVVLRSQGIANDQSEREASTADALPGFALLGGMGYGSYRGVRNRRGALAFRFR
jgi:hypothetical protein